MKQYLADADEMMIEQRDDSFSDVEDRLDFREGIVKDYPKRTLMQLVLTGIRDWRLGWFGMKEYRLPLFIIMDSLFFIILNV